jgi:hypothetical protein
MPKHMVIRVEFDLFNQVVGILLRIDHQIGTKCYNNRTRQDSAFLHK